MPQPIGQESIHQTGHARQHPSTHCNLSSAHLAGPECPLNLVATNGQVIATSEAYESKASAIKGIESVKRNAPTAEIDDQTDM